MSMADALRQIKKEFGPEALILSTREIPCRSGGGRPSSVEVVAATDGDEESIEAVDRLDLLDANAGDIRVGCSADPGSSVEGDIYSPASLRKAAGPEKTSRRVGKGKTAPPGNTRGVKEGPPPFSDSISRKLYSDLLAAGIEDWLAHKLLQTARGISPTKSWRSRAALVRLLRHAVEAALEGRRGTDGATGRKAVVFFGPTGVGKTTSIAKLAARLALAEKRKVVLMSVDGTRIGAVEQLKTYAGLMGIPFHFVPDPEELGAAILQHSQREVILVDTAGISPRDAESVRRLASTLKETTAVERHLVLSATTNPADTRTIVESFGCCSPDFLLFTKLDEAASPGAVLNELVRSGMAPSYFADGQRVPQDFHAVSRDGVFDLVLNKI